MKNKLEIICDNIDWVFEEIDKLQERINDYIFENDCDINPKTVNIKKLKKFDKECDELEMRLDKEFRELDKLAGNN